MISSLTGRRAAALLPILLTALWLMGTGTAQEASKPEAAKPEEAKPAETSNQPATYVGSQVCQACHEDIFNGFQKSPHFVVEGEKKRGWDGKACESCHGPASKHAESADAAQIRNPGKLVAAQADRICMGCHLNSPTHISRLQSSHAKNNVSCVGCHAVHKNGPNSLVARTAPAINKQCAGCHTGQWASFARPYGHKLTQGAMSCVDCHDPHGSVLPKSIQTFAGNERGCFRCHGDKRGPFTFEHAPVRLEGCNACHEPHGSANPRMLVRQEVRLVCLECHSNLPVPKPTNAAIGVTPPAFHDLRSPRYRNCTICHSKVHGSYVDQDFLK
jgi:DmsE family decaheme c-type cytochrome